MPLAPRPASGALFAAPLALLVVIAVGGCAEGAGLTPLRPEPREPRAPLSLEEAAGRYAALCASCHGEVGEGGLGPSLVDRSDSEAELAARIDRTMPENDPAACEGECAEGIARFVLTRFTTEALRCDAVPPSPRRLRLLNRREYANSVRDLLGLDGGASAPASTCEPTTFRYDPAGRGLGSVHVAGSFNGWDASAWPMTNASGVWQLTRALPVGTHEYKLVLNGGEWIADPANPETVDDTYGGRNSLVRVTCDASAAPPSPGAGATDLTEAFPIEPRPEGFAFDTSADALRITSIHLDELMRAAELAVRLLGDDGLDRLAGCGSDGRDACVARFVETFGRRAFRRPIEAEEIARYRALAAEAPDLRAAIGAVIRGMLVSPIFLYRSELGVDRGDGTFELSGFEVATALSYGLWATTPDDALLDAAQRGALDDPAEIEREARRLLDDPRGREPLRAFARQWLGIEGIVDATKIAPEFDAALADSMLRETEELVLHVVFESSGRFEELLTADHTFVDERLARLYGMEGVTGDALVRASYPDDRRSGILGHASVLASNAHSDQSSPIRRGLFVRRNLLCQEFPPPPADAGGVPDVDPSATTRERFAQHTAEPRCASCHRYIDPVGFGFEPFDPIGAWRDFENGQPVERAGNMIDVEGFGRGTEAEFSSQRELGAILAASDAAPACFVRQSYRWMRGRHETVDDRCAVTRLTERFAASGGDVRALLVDTFTSADFRIRREASR